MHAPKTDETKVTSKRKLKRKLKLTTTNDRKKSFKTMGKVMMTFIRRDEMRSSCYTVDTFYLPESIFDESSFAAWANNEDPSLVLDLTMGDKPHSQLEKEASKLMAHEEAEMLATVMDDGMIVLPDKKNPRSEPIMVGTKVFFLRVLK